ncbi:MAG: carboxymuconolactone decarboxylase family protein [Geminicoccaceae bacterium]
MALRLEYRTVAPNAVRALVGLNAYSDGCSISPKLRRLLEVLVSRINGCTYCIETHQRQALDLGEQSSRLDALRNWRNASAFLAAERSAFAWADCVTNIKASGAPDDLYQDLKQHFSEIEIVDITFVILAMNAWNRLAIAFGREAGCH